MIGGLGVYLASLVGLATMTAGVVDSLITRLAAARGPLLAAYDGSNAGPRSVKSAVLPDGDEWLATVKTERFWQENRKGRSFIPVGELGGNSRAKATEAAEQKRTKVAALTPPSASAEKRSDDGSSWYDGDGGTYRTVCVRLCDGYFWPISFSTTDDNFARDSQACERSCASPARLYVHKTPGGDVDDLADIKGQPYKKLPTAFLFRTKYVESCKCKAHPWEQEAMDRHRQYAVDAQKKGVKVAALTAGSSTIVDDAQAPADRIGKSDKSGKSTRAASTGKTSASASAPSGRTRTAAAGNAPGSRGEMMRLGAGTSGGAASKATGGASAPRREWSRQVFESSR